MRRPVTAPVGGLERRCVAALASSSSEEVQDLPDMWMSLPLTVAVLPVTWAVVTVTGEVG